MGFSLSADLASNLPRAVVISLFTWRRAEADDPLDDAERYGWWGDSFPPVADARIGSRLWLLRRAKLTAQTIMDAEFYCREALAWLIADGHVSAVAVTLERYGSDQLRGRVTLTLPDGSPLDITLDDLWTVAHAI